MNLVKMKLTMELLKNYYSSIESNSYMEHGTLNFAWSGNTRKGENSFNSS